MAVSKKNAPAPTISTTTPPNDRNKPRITYKTVRDFRFGGGDIPGGGGDSGAGKTGGASESMAAE